MRIAGLLVLMLCLPASAGTLVGKVQLVDKGGKPATDLSDVVLWVDGPRLRPKPVKAAVSMKGKVFLPHVTAVPVGSTVEFPNDDPIFHNVFSVSGDNRFDLELYKRPKKGSWTFTHPGVVRIYCNIHPQMSAIVLVTDTPFLARAQADGSFRIEGLPAGRHTLKGWHERSGEASLEVNVPAEGEVGAQLVLDGSQFKRVPHKNKFGKDYAGDDKY